MLFQSNQTNDLDAPKQLNTDALNHKRKNIQSYILAAQIDIKPEPEQALALWDNVVAWEPSPADSADPFGNSWREDFLNRVRRQAGIVLADLYTPALNATAKTEERASRLRTWILKSREWHGLQALPEFLEALPHLVDDVATLIRRALVGSYSHRVGNGALTLKKWATLARKGSSTSLPDSLIDQLISTIETRHEHGLQPLLYTARYLLEQHFISPSGVSRLLQALGELWFETQYIDTDPISRKAISLSLVRAECVKLAYLMTSRTVDDGTLKKWMETSKSDPLPEVRHALHDVQM